MRFSLPLDLFHRGRRRIYLRFYDFSVFNVKHTVRHFAERGVVGYYDYRFPGAAAGVLEKLQDRFSGVVVERSRRLVAKNELRIFCKRTRYGNALLLSAGKLSGKVVFSVRQPYGIERFGGIERLLADLRRKLDVLESCQILHEIVKLEHESYVIAAVVGKLPLPV